MINAIVVVITAIALGFCLVWLLRPSFRRWVEQPKFRMLEQDKEFFSDQISGSERKR